VKGCTKVLEYEKRSACASCKGSKCKAGTEPEKCRGCDGSGMQTVRQGMFVMQTTCGSCGGAGEKIKHFCPACNGSGVEKKRVKEEVAIPRGISDGMVIKLPKKGNFDGDLLVKVQVRKSSVFGREGHNAVSELHISVLDAILGAEKEVSTI
jgi:molecular chaperone DnaJ